MGASDRYAWTMLGVEQKSWLAGLPETLRLDGDILLVHGTPSSDLVYFLETPEAGRPRPATAAEIEQRAGSVPARLILCGHTHTPRMAGTADGRLIVNPGSVGLQAYTDEEPVRHSVEVGTPHARYAILEVTPAGIAVDQIALAYDWDAAARQAEANGRPDWARALRTGRV
jgi:predicted phosphodiesterase